MLQELLEALRWSGAIIFHYAPWRLSHVIEIIMVQRRKAGHVDPSTILSTSTEPTPSHPLTSPSSKHTRITPLHALIIGINDYQCTRISNLRGAVRDAKAMYDYLRTELHVPGSQIAYLRDEQATRQAIIHELQAFGARDTICKGDPILIYFAGHGAIAKAPEGWATAKDTISLIMPYDALMSNDGQPIQPIPDRTVGALLHDLAEPESGSGKGNNITMILDCCHSGSGTRQPDAESEYLERGLDLEEEHSIPPSLDSTIWSNVCNERAVCVPAGFAHSGSNSHVLLAACREGEKAGEDREGGMFTRALLDVLRYVAPDRTTYQGLMRSLRDIPGQTPQCEGRHSDRLLFNARVPRKGSVRYPVTVQGKRINIAAGSIHGVADGVQFSIYPPDQLPMDGNPLAIMSAAHVGSFRAQLLRVPGTCSREVSFPPACFAVQISRSEFEAVRVYIAHKDFLRPVAEALEGVHEDQRQTATGPVLLLGDKARSVFGVCERNGRIEYDIYDSLITAHGLHRLYYTSEAETFSVSCVLRDATRFFWHLHHTPKRHHLRNLVDVQIYELHMDEDAELGLDLRRPWTTRGSSISRSELGSIDVLADQGSVYGMEVRNRSSVSLHVWAFYFDCSDFSIVDYYRPSAIGNNAEPSLPGHGRLTIGYGDGGARPFTYFLRSDQNVDVGFIKVVVSTEYVDLSTVEQVSPFEMKIPRSNGAAVEHSENVWDTILIPVVQRKAC